MLECREAASLPGGWEGPAAARKRLAEKPGYQAGSWPRPYANEWAVGGTSVLVNPGGSEVGRTPEPRSTGSVPVESGQEIPGSL